MSEPVQEFNEARATRAMSERRFALGPYTLSRKASVAPEEIMQFQRRVAELGDDDAVVLDAMEGTILMLIEDTAFITDTNEPILAREAWDVMRKVGDQFGPLTLSDIAELVRWLIAGVAERPTEQPSDSPGGSPSLPTGTPSTGDSPSPVAALTLSTPDGVSTRSMPT